MEEFHQPGRFDWDAANETRHIAKHGIPFAVAAAVFLDGRRYEVKDERRAYPEPRWNTVGAVENLVLNVTFTMVGSTARIISARPAHRKERARYAETLSV